MYCILPGSGLSNIMTCMVCAFAHEIRGANSCSDISAFIWYGSVGALELTVPRTCIAGSPHNSYIRSILWSAPRKRVATLSAFSTFRTSTSSSMATTRTSRSEFFHPTITPGESDLGISTGQKILIKPSCSSMTADRSSERAPPSKLFARRDAGINRSWMLYCLALECLVRGEIGIPSWPPCARVYPLVL